MKNNDFELAKINIHNANPNILITWNNKKQDQYVIFDRDKSIYAKIYSRKEQWYIWYRKLGYRLEVKSFSDATATIEKEIVRAWAQTGQ